MCFCCCCVFPFPCVCLDRTGCDLFSSNLKIIHLIYIGASLFLFIFLIATMSIISWSRLPAVNITFFIFLFLILVACMVLSIIIVYWKSDEDRQRDMKEKIELLAKICLVLSIISIILFLIEIIIISVGFSNTKKHYPSCFENETTSVSVEVHGGIIIFKHGNGNFTTNSTISDFGENKNGSNARILSSKKEEEEDICYEEFLTPAVYGMTYFTFIVSEIVNIAAICFFNELGKSKDCYIFSETHQSVNQNNKRTQPNQNANAPPIINIQTPQVIIVNNNNGSSELINNSHQERGGHKLDKIDKSKFDKKENENNLNQNKNSNYNINKNGQQPKNLDYPEKEEAINNNVQETIRENQEIRFGHQNNININNQTIDSKDDNNIAFGSDRIVLK